MKTFLEYLYLESIKISSVDEDDYEIADAAEEIMKKVKIRIDSTKNLTLVAMNDDEVVGALYSGWTNGDTYEGNQVYEFSFDVGVDPKFQGFSLVGPKLIEESMKMYDNESSAYGEYTMIRLYVVNPKLADYLEKKYDFEVTKVGNDLILTRY